MSALTTRGFAAIRSRTVSMGTVLWIVVGLVVASNHGFLHDLWHVSRALSAVLAVAAWPLVVLGIHVAI